ncbi:MAG: hypothetical protein E7584_00340 [Ruminococcaceae bacterium]|nr:hypothetical protein [Oscillospiraceae bacterium]
MGRPFALAPARRTHFASVAQQNWVRISRPKIDKLACQAQDEDIFTVGEIPVIMTKARFAF